MTAFLLGVLSSLLATALVFVAGWLRSGTPRWWLVGLLSRLTGTGVTRMYRQQATSEADLARDLGRARWVKALMGRGNVLTRDAFAPLWSGSAAPVQVLLPAPDHGGGTWLSHRGADLERTDPGFGPELLEAQVKANTDYVERISHHHPAMEIRLFNLPHTFRIVATDAAAYLTFYGRHEHGRHSPCLRLAPTGALYDAVLGLFEFAWANSAQRRDEGEDR
ncbi:hypothetical protein [Nocardiopsis sp. NPDC006938]|uniref:hypothetical protein n=1 Tax=Nocardiopsis sp. NPDC006938 TaxID=3364337 RepID=UPI0036A0B7D2